MKRHVFNIVQYDFESDKKSLTAWSGAL